MKTQEYLEVKNILREANKIGLIHGFLIGALMASWVFIIIIQLL